MFDAITTVGISMSPARDLPDPLAPHKCPRHAWRRGVGCPACTHQQDLIQFNSLKRERYGTGHDHQWLPFAEGSEFVSMV